ncbi:hypothetical protein PRK78_002670 [Emydomyces testavorans]|uniref:G protein gamma domain-containing protein n=1 Tax=Emydomyces testavorans TaxID=2070801 RepID=A0AAF0IHS6_9EURO|nr:hypothetical protein PRK78_002670 [Emydomyces testavorans]
MEQWRERGYVPDSDEEDEWGTQEDSNRPLQTTDSPIKETLPVASYREHEHDGTDKEETYDDRNQSQIDTRPAIAVGQHALLDSALQEIEELEDDPLQGDTGLIAAPARKTAKETNAGRPQINPNGPSHHDPPSSPDELQFDQHLPAQTPATPVLESRKILNDNIDIGIESSSPLSSPPSIIQSPWSSKSVRVEQSQSNQDKVIRASEETLPLEEIPDNIPSSTVAQYGRSLRQRNAIQLHPYLLENAQYQKLLKARGLQPVRVHIVDHAPQKDSDESQNQPYQDENVPPSSSPDASFQFPPSSPALLDQAEPKPIHSRPPISQLRTTVNKYSGKKYGALKAVRSTNNNGSWANKRRKIYHDHEGGRSEERGVPGQGQIAVLVDNSGTTNPTQGSGIFDVPLSPPPSGSHSSAPSTHEFRDPNEFRFPQGMTPVVAMATPATETRQSPDALEAIIAEFASDPESDNAMEVASQVDEDSVSEVTEANPEVRQIRRKIKGVLPASWLRLDLQEYERRAKKAAKKGKLKSLERERENAKGMARKISRAEKEGTGTGGSRATAFLISDDSNSEVEYLGSGRLSQNSSRATRKQNAFEALWMDPEEDDDIPEDNRIDYMYPPAPRRPRTSTNRVSLKPRRNRDTDRDSWSGMSRGRNSRQTRITDTIPKPRRARNRAPRLAKLGVLDAPDLRNGSSKAQPHFLRVAARCARKRRDLARQSPSRKHFRLDNRNDTQDINETLREWRAGTIAQNTLVDKPAIEKRRLRNSGNTIHSHYAHVQDDASKENLPPVISNISRPTDNSSVLMVQDEVDTVDLGSHQSEPASIRTSTALKHQVKKSRLARHGFVVSSFKRNVPRSFEPDSDPQLSLGQDNLPSRFQKTLSALNSDYRRLNRYNRLPLARFLSQNVRAISKTSAQRHLPKNTKSATQALPPKANTFQAKRPRKKKPRHIDSETVEYRQPPEADFDVAQPSSVRSIEVSGNRTLKGLQKTVQSYTVDFDTFPLQIGTYFHESTFIGSGEFSRSLNILSRDLDAGCGQSVISHDNNIYRWSTWNDTVFSELGTLLERIVSEQGRSYTSTDSPSEKTQLLNLYRSIVLFISDKLSFSDPVDRRFLVERCLSTLSTTLDGSWLSIPYAQNSNGVEYGLQVEMFSLVLANQLYQIASHELVAPHRLLEINNLICDVASRIFQVTLSATGISRIRDFLEENKRLDKREAGIRHEHPFVEAYVVAKRVLYVRSQSTRFTADDLLSKTLGSLVPGGKPRDIRDLEKIWHSLMSVLPLHEFDELGIFRPGIRFKERQSHWTAVTRLISEVFEIYEADPLEQSVSFNKYLKMLFHRCFDLIKSWGWQYCNPILETLFDFFARNLLHNLFNEEVYGSPAFLDDLDKCPVFEIDPRDTCFHIFLKMVAIGLRSMAAFQETKKIRNIAWRLLPNHGRVYPKEQPLRQEDLNALRNHHDLLCTLYWAAPSGCRPRLGAIRHLVHPATSHKEACSINIHAWSRLVIFKLSTNEDNSDLVEFANWHSDFTAEMLKQHSLARTELENADVPDSTFTRQSIETAISNNQRQIESLINSALYGMKRALNSARNLSQAMILMEKLPLEKLLGLFNPSVKRLNGVVCHTLDLVDAYAAVEGSQAVKPQVSIDTSEDSQDYGDWTGFEEIYDQQMDVRDPAILCVDNSIRPALFRFVSRVFGEDRPPDDCVLTKAIETWTEVAYMLVKYRLRQWSSYLNPYDGDSWASLRATDQTRRFMPYFLACLISKAPGAFSDCKSRILNYWVESLVERDSILKFQHKLTTAILNEGRNDPLLDNLPFSVDQLSGKYNVFLDEFRQRRVSLLSCLLSNMREHLTDLEERNQTDMNLGSEYCEMIKTLMAAMRRNYEELRSPNDSVNGRYVDFVHQVVEFLQQHSQGICPIDEFFMDPSTFPLPASDPTYVAAKMKSYGVRLSTVKIAKQLVMFVQNVSERAAVDGHQAYLVDQLYKAMDHTYSDRDYQQPYLRSFMLECVFPAYVESAFSSAVGWILVRPLLQATTRIFTDLLLDVNTANNQHVSLVAGSVLAYFDSVDHALRLLTDHPGLLEEPTILLTLISFLETIIASLPFVDYVYQISESAAPLVSYVDYFTQFVLFAVSSLLDPSAAKAPEFVELGPRALSTTPAFFISIRDFATRQLQAWLKNDWTLHDGQYFVRRGMQSKIVSVDLACLSGDLTRKGFVTTVEAYFGVLEGLRTFSSTRRY